MTVSGVSVFSVSLNDLIYGAFQEAEIIASGDTLAAEDYAIAKNELNMMIKEWQAREYGLWLNQLVTLVMDKGQESYLLGPSGDHCSAAMGETAIATAGASGDGTIEVDSISGMTTGDYLGIELDDGSIQWTTINGAPAGTTVTLASVLTDSVSVDAVVFFYTTKINRPLDVLEARLRDANGIDNPLMIIPRQQYMNLSIKSTEGKVNQIYFDPQMVNAVLYVWTPTYDVSDRIIMTIKRPVYDFVNTTDTPDFPIEWAKPLEVNLASRLAPKFHVPLQKKMELKADAREKLEEVESFDREHSYIYLVPSYD